MKKIKIGLVLLWIITAAMFISNGNYILGGIVIVVPFIIISIIKKKIE